MYNLQQNFMDKFTKLSDLGFSKDSFIVDFLQVSSATVKTFVLGTGCALALSSRSFRDFLEIFFYPEKILSFRSSNYSDDISHIHFLATIYFLSTCLRWQKTALKREKISK